MLDFLSHIDLDTIEIAAGAITFLVGANVVRTALTSAIVGALGETPLALPAIAVTLAGGLLIGNGIGQIVSWIAGDYDAYSQYAEMNPFSADTDFGDATYDFYDKYINALSENYWTKTLGKKWGEELGKAIEAALIDAFDFWKDPWKAITGESWNEYWSHNGIKTEDLLKILPDIEGNGSFTLGFLNIGKYIVQGILQGATDESGNLSFKTLFDNFVKGIKKIFGIESPAKKMYSIGENIALGILEGIKNIPFLAKLNEWFDENVKPWFSEEKWKSLGDNVKNKLSSTLSYSNLYNVGYNMGKGLSDAFGKMLDNIWTDFIALKNKIANNPIIQTVKTIVEGGGSYSGGSPSGDTSGGKTVDGSGDLPGSLKNDPPQTQKTWHNVPSPSIPSSVPAAQRQAYIDNYIANWKKTHEYYPYYYAKGGYAEVGSLMVAGEAGAELVGNINGRTGVASNAEITGIRDAILQTASEEVVLLRQQNTLLQGILEKEFGISGDALFRSVRDSANSFKTRTGRPAF